MQGTGLILAESMILAWKIEAKRRSDNRGSGTCIIRMYMDESGI